MILLASYGLRSPMIAGMAMEYIKPEGLKVLVIPFAGFDSENTAKREIDEGLVPFGFSPDNIFVLKESNAEECRSMHFDVVYVPGGNPFKLLWQLQNSDLCDYVADCVKKGATYFGISAGADLAGENLEYLRLASEDCDYPIKSYNGLSLIHEKILCHVDQRDMGTLQRVRDCDERKAIFIRNDEMIVIKDE